MVTVLMFEDGITSEHIKMFAKMFEVEDKYQDEQSLKNKAEELNRLNQVTFKRLKYLIQLN